MELAEDAQRGHVGRGQDVVVSVLEGWPVIEHQKHAGDDLDDEQEERGSPHAPRIRKRDPLLPHADGVQVQEEVGEHHHHPITSIGRHGMAEDAFPELRFSNFVQDRHGPSLKVAD